jgi:hypothetical protein
MRPMRGSFAILAALSAVTAAVLIPAGYVSAPAAQASDIQPVGQAGWTLVNNLDGQQIYNTFNLEPLTGDGCNNENYQGSVSVDSLGNLKLTTYKDKVDYCAEVASPWTVAPGYWPAGHPFAVYVEWKASIPLNSWAALWLTGGSPWPQNGEIDVAEVQQKDQLCQAFHYLQANGQHGLIGNYCADYTSWSGQWHTYGVEWTLDSLGFYYDGTLVTTMAPDPNTITTVPEQVLMDVVNMGWVGSDGPEASLYINYVRTWTSVPIP